MYDKVQVHCKLLEILLENEKQLKKLPSLKNSQDAWVD